MSLSPDNIYLIPKVQTGQESKYIVSELIQEQKLSMSFNKPTRRTVTLLLCQAIVMNVLCDQDQLIMDMQVYHTNLLDLQKYIFILDVHSL